MAQPHGSGAHPRPAPLALPACLRLRPADSPHHGVGVFAAAPLPRGFPLGPYEGRPVMAGAPAGAGGYSWRVRHGRLVDGGNVAHSNWMRFVNRAPHAARHNLAGFQHRGALYFRTMAPVADGDELLVYFGDDYARNVDVDGYYNYCPPKEALEPEFATTGDAGSADDHYICDIDCVPPKEEPQSEFVAKDDGSGGGGTGDDCAHIVVNGYGSPKEGPESKSIDIVNDEPKSEFATIASKGGDGGAGDEDAHNIGYYDPHKKGPESKLGGNDADADDDYDPTGDDGCCDDGSPKEDSSKFIDIVCHPLKDEPELDCGNDDYSSLEEDPESKVIDIVYHPLEEEPEPELAAAGSDAGTDGSRAISYNCSYCEISLSTRKFKVEHELRCKVVMKQKELESQITKLYHCGYCRCPFPNQEFKEQHLQRWCRKRPVVTRMDSNGTYFECDKCKFVTKFKKDLERHVLNHNNNNVKWFTCTQCSYKTARKHSMTAHIKIHGNSFSCCCPICGKSFRKKQCLDEHLLKAHFEESDEVSTLITKKIYTCNICDKFRTVMKFDFNKHRTETHLKDIERQKYQCPHCPFSTFAKGCLTKHTKKHGVLSAQKDYQCAVCKNQFTLKSDLDSHILHNHADNADLVKTITSKIHRCKSCSFKTVLLKKLRIHVRSKHI